MPGLEKSIHGALAGKPRLFFANSGKLGGLAVIDDLFVEVRNDIALGGVWYFHRHGAGAVE